MRLQKAWYRQDGRKSWWLIILSPLALLFWLISSLRKLCYRLGIFKAYRSSLPIIIVGNISTGGNGKTPVVLALLEHFGKQGIRCAVLSRGYGATRTGTKRTVDDKKNASNQAFPHLLNSTDKPEEVGDEPALICGRFDIPVVIDPKRGRGAQFIESNTDAQVIICDDGMQHYALTRDIEICVMDGRGVGNGFLLPMGPLRERTKRLSSVDLLIYNGTDANQHAYLRSHALTQMRLASKRWVNVSSGKSLPINQGLAQFANASSIAAIAGIGDPQRFFTTLEEFGISLGETIALPDHYLIQARDIPDADLVLMTEKDAVKCREFASDNCWYLEVDAVLPDEFYRSLAKKLAHIATDINDKGSV